MPPSRTPIEPRTWLPWAAVACLAALVAGLGELWILERMHTKVLRDEAEISQAALQSADNQLEAERILARSLPKRPPTAHFQILLLAPPPEGASESALPKAGALVWLESEDTGALVLSGGLPPPSGKAYRLWMESPDGGVDCGLVDAAAAQTAGGVPVRIPADGGSRFLLILGSGGEGKTLANARADGSIVLASLPPGGKISPPR